MKTYIQKTCEQCSKEFPVHGKAHHSVRRFCSHSCYSKSISTGRVKMSKTCLECGGLFWKRDNICTNDFNKQKCCSSSCWALFRVKENPQLWSEARAKAKISLRLYRQAKGEYKTKISKLIRGMVESIIWRTSVFVRDQYTCMECGVRSGMGKKIILHAHHIKPLASILRENSIKTPEEAISCLELWDTSNGVTLCKGCHAKTDSYMGKYNKNYVN